MWCLQPNLGSSTFKSFSRLSRCLALASYHIPSTSLSPSRITSIMASRTPSLLAPLVRQLRPQAFSSTKLSSRLRPRTNFAPIQRITAPVRLAHSIPRPTPNPENYKPSESPDSESSRPATRGPAYYQLSFTCVPCGHRSHHNISKQGYHTGSTLITCPGCRNRHVISDHLNIFGDKKQTIEDIMREKGQLVKRGSLGEDGDIEFWPDEPSEQQESP